METEAAVRANEELSMAMVTLRSEIHLAASKGHFHARIPISDSALSQLGAMQSSLHQRGFATDFDPTTKRLRVEWGHNVCKQSFSIADLESLPGKPNITVAEAAASTLCQPVPRSVLASKFYDPALTVLSPEAVLERAKNAIANLPKAPPPPASAQAISRTLDKLTRGETGARLSRLSSAAQQVEAEASLNAIEDVIESQRETDDSLHMIDNLFTDIRSSARQANDPFADLERALEEGPSDRRLREVEALIEEVDMAATPNTRRKKADRRKKEQQAMLEKAAQNNAKASAHASANQASLETRPELSKEVLERTSRAQDLAEKTFQEEQARLLAEEKRRAETGDTHEDEARRELIKAADEAEKDAEASTRSMFVASSVASSSADTNAAETDEKALAEAEKANKLAEERARKAEAETRDRALKEAAQAEERRNLMELKAAQMEALAAQREKEEAAMEEEIAKQELEARAREEEERAKEEAMRAKIEAEMKEREAKLAAQQAAEEANMAAKMEEAKKKIAAEAEAKKKAAAEIKAPQFQFENSEFPPITPIAPKGNQATDLETPASVWLPKEELNIEDMLGNLNLDLDTTATRDVSQAAKTPAGKLAANNEGLPRDSGVTRELAGIDDLMAGLDMTAFSIDDSASADQAAASKSNKSSHDSSNSSRDGGIRVQEAVKEEDTDVDSALSSLDFGSSLGTKKADAKAPQHQFSSAKVHETAKEVNTATHLGPAASAVPTASGSNKNMFDDFKIDVLDVSGMDAPEDVEVDFAKLGVADKADAEAKAKVKAEADSKAKAEAEVRAKAEAAAKAAAEEKKSEVINDEKSGASFGNKAAMFEQMASPEADNKPAAKKKNKKKNKKKGKK